MLALLAPIKSRLAALPALAGFDVRDAYAPCDRSKLPAVDVRMVGTGPGNTRGQGVFLAPVWRITLIVKVGPAAAAALDAAMAEAIEALYGWAPPGQLGGRAWERLTLVQTTEAEIFAEGAVGYQLDFITQALYRGQIV